MRSLEHQDVYCRDCTDLLRSVMILVEIPGSSSTVNHPYSKNSIFGMRLYQTLEGGQGSNDLLLRSLSPSIVVISSTYCRNVRAVDGGDSKEDFVSLT